MNPHFENRQEAGLRIASFLWDYKDRSDVLVLGLPRGGMVVASVVASQLRVSLDMFMVCKVLSPRDQSRMGTIAEGGVVILEDNNLEDVGLSEPQLEEYALEKVNKVEQREQFIRMGRQIQDLKAKTLILVDDGLSTGFTMRSALMVLSQKDPAKIIVALPLGTRDACNGFYDFAQKIICCEQGDNPIDIAAIYRDYPVITDQQVQQLLLESKRRILQTGKENR